MKISLFFIFSTAALIDDALSSDYWVQRAAIGQFEFPASIYSKGLHKCNGAIISFIHIITTAHCIYNETILDLRVTAGTMSVSRATKWRQVQNTHIFSGYDSKTNDDDIGIIQLKEPLSDSKKIQIIPYRETGQNCAIDLECKLVWFKAEETDNIHKTSQRLWWRKIDMSIVNDRWKLYIQPEDERVPFKSRRPEDNGAPIVCNSILTAILATPMTTTGDKAATVVMIGPYEHWIEKTLDQFQS